MGRQTRFFVVREDMKELLRFAEENHFGALPVVIETDSVPEFQLPTEFKETENRDIDFFFLMTREFAAVEAFYAELPKEKKFSKMLMRTSPVIQISPSNLDSRCPKEGRIYTRPNSTDPFYKIHLKSYNLLRRFIKKWPKSADGVFHIGPKTAKMCISGELQIKYGHNIIEIAK